MRSPLIRFAEAQTMEIWHTFGPSPSAAEDIRKQIEAARQQDWTSPAKRDEYIAMLDRLLVYVSGEWTQFDRHLWAVENGDKPMLE